MTYYMELNGQKSVFIINTLDKSELTMRILITVLLITISSSVFANMASPYRDGTKVAAAFTSRDVDIISERINVTLNKENSTADYFIEYRIRTEADGIQIPLLFYAVDYKGDFKVWVDDEEVKVQKIPDDYLGKTYEGFSGSYNNRDIDKAEVVIKWRENLNVLYKLSELKYFEAGLTKGEHIIRVKYTANLWENRSNWVKEYGYRYSLSPAKFWKSFGTLEITVNAVGFGEDLKTNLGKQTSGRLDSAAVWKFDKLPVDVFEVSYIPKINSTATFLLKLEPFGLALIIGIALAIIHLFMMWKHRQTNPGKRFSWVMILGSFVVPGIILFYYVYSFDIIDSAIGEHASRYHGYNFLVLFIYPVVLVVYLLVMWVIDSLMKKRLNI
jgi:hypothetical protein